jgi:SAM-dependent methyltransferase
MHMDALLLPDEHAVSDAPPVTLGQIAELAGVRPSAVSNWRKRFDDFPPPTASATGGRDLFSLDAVETWLVEHNRLAGAKESERFLFKATEILRADLDVKGIIDVVCAALAFVYVRTDTDELAGGVAFDRRICDDPAFAEPFAPLAMLKAETRVHLLQLVDQLTPSSIPSLFSGVLARHQRFVETRTSDRLIELLVRVGIDDSKVTAVTRIFDPAAGQANLLLAAAKAAGPGVELTGQEFNHAAWRIAKQRFYVEGQSASIELGDSLLEDAYPDLRADVVLCDPPYGLKRHFPAAALADGRWKFGVPGTGVADFAWLQHAIHHLTADGRGYVLLPASTLSRNGRDAEIRAQLLRQGAVEAIVALPPRAAEHTAISLALWIVRRPIDESNPKVLLIDGTRASPRPREPLDEPLIERIEGAVEVWRQQANVLEADRGFAIGVSVMDLLGPRANLRPARWVHQESQLDVEQRRQDFRNATRAASESRWQLLEADIRTGKLMGDPSALAWISVRDLIADGRAELVRGIRLRPEDARSSGTRVLRDRSMQPGDPEPPAYVDLTALPQMPRLTRPGDIIVSLAGDDLKTLVETRSGCALALPLQALRLDEEWLDPTVAAAFLASPRNRRLLAGMAPMQAHLEVRELQLPAVPVDQVAELREMLGQIERSEQLAHDVLSASREARDALLDLGGYVVMPQQTHTRHEQSSR